MKLKKSFSAPELLEKATTLCWSREQLESVLRESESALPEIDLKLQAARYALAQQEAARALDNQIDATQELNAVNELASQRESTRARVAGIQQRLADQE